MDHYSGISADERWKNDLLNELREIKKMLEHNAQVVEQPNIRQVRKPRGGNKS